jgi:hypothetical protein
MTNDFDLNDPADRARAIEHLGIERYRLLMEEHRRRSIIKTVAGHDLRRVFTGFGPLIHVGNTKTAFQTLEQAEKFANEHPMRKETR